MLKLLAALEALFAEHTQAHPAGASVMPTVTHETWREVVDAAHTTEGELASKTRDVLQGLVQMQHAPAHVFPQFAAGHWQELKDAFAAAKGDGNESEAPPPDAPPPAAPSTGAQAEVPPDEHADA